MMSRQRVHSYRSGGVLAYSTHTSAHIITRQSFVGSGMDPDPGGKKGPPRKENADVSGQLRGFTCSLDGLHRGLYYCTLLRFMTRKFRTFFITVSFGEKTFIWIRTQCFLEFIMIS
jgi:hypothetical protein